MEEGYNEDRVGKILTRIGLKEKDSKVTLEFEAWVRVKTIWQRGHLSTSCFKGRS